MIVDGLLDSSIALAAKVIRSGGLVGLPTETVYGLGADAENDAAVAQIFKAKGRPAGHPLSVLVANVSCVAHFAAKVPDFAHQLMQAFWPGPLTLILPRRPGVAEAAAGGNNTIGLRCPAHPVVQALLKTLNGGQIPINSKELESDPHLVWGLAAPSANQFGRVSPTTAQHVKEEFGDDLMILDGGACSVGIESTIIDCTRAAPLLLRPGAITPEQVQTLCGLKVQPNEELILSDTPAPKSFGTLESHYAPKAKVRLMAARALQSSLDLLGAKAAPGRKVDDASGCNPDAALRLTHPLIAVYARSALTLASPWVPLRRMPKEAPACARELFAVLREFDAQSVQQIWIETPPAAPEWDGVRDRLQRASA